MKAAPLSRLHGSAAFWFCASIVFTANALISASRGEWVVMVMQTVTGLLAVTASLSVASRPEEIGEAEQ